MKTLFTLLAITLLCCHPLSSSAQSWNLTGNAFTNPSLNYVGTSDLEPLVFRVNNFRAGYIAFNDAPGNAGLGYGVFQAISSGTLNSAFGHKALYSCTTGLGNTALGFKALNLNTTGSYNSAMGAQALLSNSGSYNTAAGYAALYTNTSGGLNVAVGYKSLFSNLIGYGNSALGYGSLYSNTGSHNTAVGDSALYSNTTALGNTAVGFLSLYYNTDAGDNTAIGDGSLYYNSSGWDNTSIGSQSLYHNSSGEDNTSVGSDALFYGNGSYNTAVGSFALEGDYAEAVGSSNTAIGAAALWYDDGGSENTATGNGALASNSTGSNNTATGCLALERNATGYSNVAVGISSLFSSQVQSNLVAVGDSALFNNGATANVAVGSKALFGNFSGMENSALGYQSGFSNTTGSRNTGCGYKTLYTNTTGSDITMVGYSANVTQANLSNATGIGSSVKVSASNCVVLGNSSVTKLGIGVTPFSSNIVQFQTTTAKLTTGGAWTNASDRKLKNNFQKLDSKNILDKVNSLDIERWHYIADGEPVTHIGPVAQDFHEAFGVGDDTTISTIDPSGVALLAIQALSKHNDAKDAQIQSLQNENDDLKSRLDKVEAMMNQMGTALSQCCASYQPSAVSNQKASEDRTADAPRLEQNAPNPFSQNTTIQFYIPSSVNDGMIVLTDLSGKILQQFNHLSTGNGTIIITAGTLASGTYQYSLIVNGKVSETKQMILTK